MKFAKLSQKLSADQNRYKAMSEKKRKSFYGRFIMRRIRKTIERIKVIEESIGVFHGPGGNYNPN